MSKHRWFGWVRRAVQFGQSSRNATKTPRRRPVVPCLEPLEDRCVLTTLVGFTTAGNLVRFDSTTPGTVTNIAAVTGLTAGQSLVALDFRPLNGQLFGMGFGGTTGQIYTIDPTTAVATAVGTPFSTTLTGTTFAMDFDPVADQVRVIDNTAENLRVNPATGALLSVDTPITAGQNIAGLAYDRNFRGATATTAYGYNFTTDNLVTIGSINGSPNSANTGIVTAVGASGVVTAQAGNLGFDIDANATAYLNLVVGANSGLYTENLTTGAVTLVGNFPAGTIMTDISAAPAVSFKLSPAPFVKGVAQSFTVTALDAFGNTATSYSGTVAITSSDTAAVLPASAVLVNGVGTFTVTMNTLGSQTITASEQGTNAITATATVLVAAPTDIVGVNSTGQLVRFSSATPGTLTTIGAVTGLTAGQTLVGIDFRPSNGQLYGLGFGGTTGQLYTINPTTAVATAVGTPFSTTLNAADAAFGFDFDPVADQIRITTNSQENLRVNPDTGALVATDSNINPVQTIAGLAYDRNVRGATQTTAFGYNFNNDHLVTVGSINGTPNSPNTGTLTDIGPSGVVTAQSNNLGFDIGSDSIAYLNLVVGGNSGLYTENLSTGTVSLVGNFTAGVILTDVSVAPAVSLQLSGLSSTHIAGASSPFKVTAVDVFGNAAGGYQGTVHFTSSDTAAVLPANSTLTNGIGTFNVTFNTLGNQSLTATDTVVSTITATASNIPVVAATELVGVTSTGSLVRFSSATPNTITTIGAVTGLAAGQTLVAVDFRPKTGELYGMGFAAGTGQLYKINPTTAAATAVGTPFSTTLTGAAFGFGFDPVADQIRVTSNTLENLRVNPDTGALLTADTNLSTGAIVGLAYDRNFLGATQTTAFGYNFSNDHLVTIGSVNGTPNSANSGLITDVGASGVTTQQQANLGFDIGSDSVGYLNLVVGGTSGLYTENLTTGLVSLIGNFGSVIMTDLTVAPATKFAVTGFPSPINPNVAGTVTVTAQDVFGTTVPGYKGTVHITSSDPAAVLPANSTLTNGSASFTVKLSTGGTQSITATDTVNNTITGTQTGIVVNKPFNFDKLGAYRASDGSWSLDSDGTFGFNAASDQVFFHFSPPGVQGVAGDWTGTGRDNVGDFSNGVWHLDLNGNGLVDSGETFNFGQAGDKPVVGDWTGDGISKLGVFRTAPDGITGEFIIDSNNNRQLDAGDTTFQFGLGTDRIVVGDWTGDKISKVGVFRDATAFGAPGAAVFSLDINNNHTFDSGDQVFVFGLITDGLVIGDWNGNGISKVGVYRDGSQGFNAPGTGLFSLDINGNRQFDSGTDSVFLYGLTTDQFVGGDWVVTPPLLPSQFAANGRGPGGQALADAQLTPVVQQAKLNWEATGIDPARLAQVSVQIGQLGGSLVGTTSGNQITLDATAAGWGWFVDPTPNQNEEFGIPGPNGLQAQPGSPAAGKMDLLTVVEHELGHELGLNDLDPAAHPSDLMAATLPTGTRRSI